ncbi:ribosome silencing factor [Nibricoccus aquaticus]|uniref:Ribosomal silencing factor RsfS n=1 Tax=Nibricoccus aquaticus TaxID=2576891 RepID=A0A290QD98_9BACT|nr:ribosome silencing factor [Nibricoccus aquaticus]ATC63308.1 ribosome silencing factor [Nibricoccus aquaticus]
MNSTTPTTAAHPALLALICKALDEKKADDLRVLDVSEQSSITDYLILATGNSEPHLRALRVELEKVIDATGTKILGMDKGLESGWLVVDAFDLMIHVFTPENRKKYALENLWKDAEDIPVEALVNPEAYAAKVKAGGGKAAKAPAKTREAPVKAKAPRKEKATAKVKAIAKAKRVAKAQAAPKKKAAAAKKPAKKAAKKK